MPTPAEIAEGVRLFQEELDRTVPALGSATTALNPVLRTLRDVLMDARPYVADSRDWSRSVGDRTGAEGAELVLERVDGAIAEADEVLS